MSDLEAQTLQAIKEKIVAKSTGLGSADIEDIKSKLTRKDRIPEEMVKRSLSNLADSKQPPNT